MNLTNVFDRDESVEVLAAAIEEDGYAIVQGLLDRSQLEVLCDELGPHLQATKLGNEDFWGHKTKRFGALLRKSKMAQQMVVNATVLGVADHVLLPYCASYWLNYTGVMHLAPGETAQTLHRDTNLWPFANPAPPLTLATMWAVSDFTRTNGGTLLVPGSHRWDDVRAPKAVEMAAAEMPAGSVLMYTGNVIHGGGANRSDGIRFGLALHYVLGWLRQEETQLLTLSMDEARALPEQVQKLIGYSLGAANLGFVDHRDPFELLTGHKASRPRALSTPELERSEEKMYRLSVVGRKAGGRTRFDIEPEAPVPE
ncbi:MAG: phytanoyl-CoA dioxygenase family protein [Gammaproteobacteria bacterium]